MVSYCCVRGCMATEANSDRRFYRLPNLKAAKGRSKEIFMKRRRLWEAAINRNDLNIKHARICSNHFVSGVKAKSQDVLNVDWVPTLNLVLPIPSKKRIFTYKTYKRQRELIAKQAAKETTLTYMEIQAAAPEKCITTKPSEEADSYEEPIIEEFEEGEFLNDLAGEIDPLEPSHQSNETQTNLTMDDIIGMFANLENQKNTELAERELELVACRQELASLKINFAFFEDNDIKTEYFTGLSHYFTLITIYNAIEENIPDCLRKALNKFQIFVLTLIKLRLDLRTLDLSDHTVSKKFYECVSILGLELGAFISWPELHVRSYYMPETFARIFGTKLAVIVDFLEIRIEKCGEDKPAAGTATCSKHKNTDTETMKYLIGINPSGAINYTSRGYNGKASDKIITENSDFLNFLLPGDIVLSARDFSIKEAVCAKGAEQDIPEFARGRVELDTIALEDSEDLACVKFLVGRMVDTLREKYFILSNTQPFVCIKKQPMHIDAIVRACCGLNNLCPSVVPSNLLIHNI